MKTLDSVLLIEDDVITAFLIKTLMEKFDFCKNIQIYDNGEEALNQISNLQNLPEVIFLDLNMPVMNGWEFLNHLQKQQTLLNIPIYILTSSIDPLDKERAKKFPNVKGYLVKPLSLRDLEKINSSL
ncbi:response regulator [Leptospira sp. 96542]|nr:response regulator [Leptospira sp. 96542]